MKKTTDGFHPEYFFQIIHRGSTKTLEVYLTGVMVILGVLFISPIPHPVMFRADSPLYQIMNAIAPEEAWGFLLLLSSSLRVYGLCKFPLYRNIRWRRLAATGGMLFWGVLFLSLLQKFPIHPSAVLTLSLFLAEVWLSFRFGGDGHA